MTCHGNAPDSPCCYIPVGVDVLCKFVTKVPGRKAGCGLYVELGSWEAVHTDQRYLECVQPFWIEHGVPDCGDWVGPGCCYGPDPTPESDVAYRKAAERPGTPVEIKRVRGLVTGGVEGATETVTEPPPIPRSKKQRVPLGQRPKP